VIPLYEEPFGIRSGIPVSRDFYFAAEPPCRRDSVSIAQAGITERSPDHADRARSMDLLAISWRAYTIGNRRAAGCAERSRIAPVADFSRWATGDGRRAMSRDRLSSHESCLSAVAGSLRRQACEDAAESHSHIRVGAENSRARRRADRRGVQFFERTLFPRKLAYATAFGEPVGGFVITTDRGLLTATPLVTHDDLSAFSNVDLGHSRERYVAPLRKHAEELAGRIEGDSLVVLLGSIATGKYCDTLTAVFGRRLVFRRRRSLGEAT
jgi:hypothetical protein